MELLHLTHDKNLDGACYTILNEDFQNYRRHYQYTVVQGESGGNQ